MSTTGSLFDTAPLKEASAALHTAESIAAFTESVENAADYPEGWIDTTVGMILPVTYGKGLISGARKGGEVPVYGSNGIVGHHNEAITTGPTIIIGRKGSVGEVHLSKVPCWPIDTTYYVEPNVIDVRFATYLLRTLNLSSLDTSTAIPGLNRDDLYSQSFSLPPLAEQQRIVEAVEAALIHVNTARESLARVPKILKRFRQSVLAAACSGRLTADWRQANLDVEPASVLLERIQAERKAKEGKKYKEPTPVDASEVEELPEEWELVTFGDIVGELRNGVSPRPEPNPPGLPVLRISSTRACSVDLNDVRYLPEGEKYREQFRLQNDDLLFTRYNGSLDLLGVCGMVRGLANQDILYPDKLMRVRFGHSYVKPAYAEIYFSGPYARDRVTKKSKSSAGQQGVSGEDIKQQPFTVPPLTEQTEIVRRVNHLFALADMLEKRVASATIRVEKTTQAVLAKAFRGELVPTEAELARQEGREYEPASVLLERIKSERGAETSTKARRGRASKKG